MPSRHTLGSFSSPPLPSLVVNPLSAVPKKRSGKLGLIMHLSYTPGSSVNDGIDNNDFPLRYSTIYDEQWSQQWRTLCICLLYDNQAIVHCLVSGSSRNVSPP